MALTMSWEAIPSQWKEIFKKNLIFQTELVTQQHSQSKFAARYYDMDTYWQVFFPRRSLDLSITAAEYEQLLKLTKLKCGGTKVDSLVILAELGLVGLEYLDCNHTKIESLDELARIDTLLTLEIEYTAVSDLSPLRSSAGLRQLYFSHTKVIDIGILAQLPALTNLDFNDTGVSDLSALHGLSYLQTLVMNGCSEIRDLSALGHSQALVKLDISRTGIASLADLETHSHLQILVAGELDISSVDVVRELPDLESLYINNTRNTIDLDSLRSSKSLRALYIGGTEITNVDALLDVESLEILFHSNLSDRFCKQLKIANPKCTITKQ